MVIDIYETLWVMAELGQLCEKGHRYGGTVRVMGIVIDMAEPYELWRNSGSYVRKVIDICGTLRVMGWS